jgi:Delta24-sterol reductase
VLGGLKCLYAHSYYTDGEFGGVHDEREYDTLREKHHATYLPSVRDKVKVDLTDEGKKANELGRCGSLPFFGVFGL